MGKREVGARKRGACMVLYSGSVNYILEGRLGLAMENPNLAFSMLYADRFSEQITFTGCKCS